MNVFCRFVIVCLLFGLPLAKAVESTPPPQLTGPRVVVLPYVEVPFLSSEIVIRKGHRDAKTGACIFPIDMQLRHLSLGPGERLGRIQRAYDPDTCRELVEEGILVDDQSGNQPNDLSTHKVGSTLATTPQVNATTAAAAQYSATAQILYTDGNNPLMSPFRALGINGIEVSYGKASIDLTVGDCVTTPVVNNYSGESGYQPYTGWSEAAPLTLTPSVSCSGAGVDLATKHQNSGSLPLAFDCSDVVTINYSPLRLTLDIYGNKQLTGSVFVSGDMTSCGEYLARFETLE